MSSDRLLPFRPGRDGAWDARAAFHLLRRAGFGASKAEVQRALDQGLLATVEALFEDAPDEEDEFQQTFERIAGTVLSDISDFQAWWCYRMVRTRAPLREKLALFWHGHFATSYYKVSDAALMHRQLATFRRLAWADFGDLTLAVARDPAMLVYLDGESSTREQPNENFARELMELFTCGIGHYTEEDVREAARAFTGWHRNGYEFFFNAEAHDDGMKTLLGRRGRLDGGHVVDTLMRHPATPRFLARKLLRFFATPDPDDEVVEEAGGRLARAGLNVKAFLRALFVSRYFFSSQCVGRRIASPAEFVIGTVRTLGCRVPSRTLRDHLTAMGQELFAPPNVKGWDGEEKWINSSTWAARVGFAQALSEMVAYGEFDPDLGLQHVVPADLTDPKKVLNALAAALFPGELPEGVRKELAGFLITTEEGRDRPKFEEDGDFRSGQTRRAVAVLLSLPESQRC